MDERSDAVNDDQRDHNSGRKLSPHHEAGFWVQPDEVEIEGARLDFAPAYYDIDKLPSFDPAPGVRMNVMVGGKMMANWVRIEPEVEVPRHAHEHEQIGLVLEGEITMIIGDESRVLRPGHAYTIPGNYPHAAKAGAAGCLVLDIFSPPREEYRAAAK